MTILNLMRFVYVADLKGLAARIVSVAFGKDAAFNRSLCQAVWHRFLTTMTLAVLQRAVAWDRSRQQMLILLGIVKKNPVYLRAERSARPGYPYTLDRTGICHIGDIDKSRYDFIPTKTTNIDVVPLLEIAENSLREGKLLLGSYHIIAERKERLAQADLWFDGGYANGKEALNVMVKNSLKYGLAAPKTVRVVAYKGELQVALLLIDERKRFHPNLSLILSINQDGSVVAPTILRTDMIDRNLRSVEEMLCVAA